jgi:hypothetical protein
MGDASAFGFQFRGARVVKAVIKDLVQRHGLGSNSHGRDTLIFAGGSAGARGVMVHLDYVSDMLGSAANAVKVVGFMDSPLWVQMPAVDSHQGRGDFVTETKTMHQFANVTHLGNACAARYKADQWKCLFAEYRMPFVKSRYLLVASQYDKFQLRSYIGHKPVTPKEVDFAEQFGRRTLAVVENLVSDRHAVLSWACYNHMLSLSNRFSKDATEEGVTLINATEQFLGLVPHEGKELGWIDRCHGFDCGKNCYRPLRQSFSIGSPFNAGGRPTLGSAQGSNDGPDLPAEEQEAGVVSVRSRSDGLSEEAQILARLGKAAQPVVATTTTAAMLATASTTGPAHQAGQAAHNQANNAPDATPGATITVQEFHARMARAPSILAVNITFGRMDFNKLRSYHREAIRSTLVKECAAVAAVHTSAVKDVDGMSQSISLAPVQEQQPGKGFVAKARIDVPREQSTGDIMTVFSFYSMRQRIAAALSRLWTEKFDPAFINVSCEEKSAAAFVSVDVDHDGALDLGELFSATKVSDPPLTGLQAEYVFGQLDVDFNGKLSPEEYEVIVVDAKQNPTTTSPASSTSWNAANRGGHPRFAKATAGEANTEDQRLNVTITSQDTHNPTTTSPASSTLGNHGDHHGLAKATAGEADTEDQRLNVTITSQEGPPQGLPSSMIIFGALLSLMVPQCLWCFVSYMCPKKQRRFMETCGEMSPKSQEAQFGIAQQANFSSSLTGEAYQARQAHSLSTGPPSVIEELAYFFRCHAVGPTAYPRPGVGLAV